MGWKPKEKQLTHEEAIELAKKELAPFWLGTGPLLAGVRGGDGKTTAHPLEPLFEKMTWLIIFADLTNFAGEGVLQYAREWVRRYASPDLGLLLVIRATYSYMTSAESLKGAFKKLPESFPYVLDHDGILTQAFCGPKPALPAIQLLHQRQILFEHSGSRWVDGAEAEIQKFLRLKDPGLPLAPAFESSTGALPDSAQAEFGGPNRSPLFKITGKVSQEADRVLIQDPTAVVQFVSAHPRVAIVAVSAIAGHPVSRMRVELNGDPVFEAAAGVDLTFGDDGGSEIKVSDGRLYRVLRALPLKARRISLKFPDADRLPVALHCVRFSDS